MERMNDEGQWIVLMGFIVSVGILFLAIILNQSVLVGQTTSEGIIEFPKNEIIDIREEILDSVRRNINEGKDLTGLQKDISLLSLDRENAVVTYSYDLNKFNDIYYEYTEVVIHFNNGVTSYDETYLLPKKI